MTQQVVIKELRAQARMRTTIITTMLHVHGMRPEKWIDEVRRYATEAASFYFAAERLVELDQSALCPDCKDGKCKDITQDEWPERGHSMYYGETFCQRPLAHPRCECKVIPAWYTEQFPQRITKDAEATVVRFVAGDPVIGRLTSKEENLVDKPVDGC